MSNYRVSVRYAKSLLLLAIETGNMEKVRGDIEMFIGLCRESRPFLLFIKNPVLHSYKKLSVFKRLFEGKVDELSLRFIEIITRKGREDLLPDIANQFLREYRIYNNIEIVDLTTPIPLDEDLKKEFLTLSQKMIGKNKKIDLHEHVDDQLLGGYVLKIGDKQIDDSVSAKLRELRKKLIVS